MKKIKWVNGNKMVFESDHKEFNRQTKCISKGNCMGDTQSSGYIRAYNETKCNGQKFEKGHLQNYDLNWLNTHLPVWIKDWVKKMCKYKRSIGYSFFYWKGKERIFIGWIITNEEYDLLMKFYARDSRKTISALDECAKYICN